MKNIAASSAFFMLTAEDPSKIKWESLLQHSLEDEATLVQNAYNNYYELKSARDSERIAILGAMIRTLTTKGEVTLERQAQLQNGSAK